VRIDPALAAGNAAICVGLPGAARELPDQRVDLHADPDYVAPRPVAAGLIAKG